MPLIIFFLVLGWMFLISYVISAFSSAARLQIVCIDLAFPETPQEEIRLDRLGYSKSTNLEIHLTGKF